MKSLKVFLSVILTLLLMVSVAAAYDINGDPGATIGYPTYATYGLNATNFTPGVNSGNIILDLFTNFPQGGVIEPSGAFSWNTQPADIFITENYFGTDLQWAVPLVDRPGFTAGTMYAVGSYRVSDTFDPSGGTAYIYNHNVPVQINTVGSNPGGGGNFYSSIGGGSVAWSPLSPGLPDYMVRVALGLYEDDPFATWTINWGTATCANDVLTGVLGGVGAPEVPIPPTALLLGSGLVGLAGLGWRRKSLKLAA